MNKGMVGISSKKKLRIECNFTK